MLCSNPGIDITEVLLYPAYKVLALKINGNMHGEELGHLGLAKTRIMYQLLSAVIDRIYTIVFFTTQLS